MAEPTGAPPSSPGQATRPSVLGEQRGRAPSAPLPPAPHDGPAADQRGSRASATPSPARASELGRQRGSAAAPPPAPPLALAPPTRLSGIAEQRDWTPSATPPSPSSPPPSPARSSGLGEPSAQAPFEQRPRAWSAAPPPAPDRPRSQSAAPALSSRPLGPPAVSKADERPRSYSVPVTSTVSRTSSQGEGKMGLAVRRLSSIHHRHALTPVDVAMAGPMRRRDGLHLLNLIISLGVVALVVNALLHEAMFVVHLQHRLEDDPDAKSLKEKKSMTLRSIEGCLYKDFTDYVGVVCEGKLEGKDRNKYPPNAVFETAFWVTNSYYLSMTSSILAALSVLIQVINQLKSHFVLIECTSVIAGVNAVLLMLNGVSQFRYALYQRAELNEAGSTVLMGTWPGFLLLMAVVWTVVSIAFMQVVTRGPGPLSTNTRFLFSLKEEQAIRPSRMAPASGLGGEKLLVGAKTYKPEDFEVADEGLRGAEKTDFDYEYEHEYFDEEYFLKTSTPV